MPISFSCRCPASESVLIRAKILDLNSEIVGYEASCIVCEYKELSYIKPAAWVTRVKSRRPSKYNRIIYVPPEQTGAV